MAVFSDIDVRLMLYRLRPGETYDWLGSGDTGYPSLAACVGWTAGTTAPTESELLAEWDVYLAELAAEEQEAQERLADLQALETIASLLTEIDGEQTELDADKQTIISDLDAFDSATNAQKFEMLKRLMQDNRRLLSRENNALQREKKILRAVRRLVKWKLNTE